MIKSNRATTTLEVFNKSPNPLAINDIHEKSRTAISQVSATIAELENVGLIECLTPQDKIGKLYRITKEGKEITTTMSTKEAE